MNNLTKMTHAASMFIIALLMSLYSFNLSAQTTDTGWMTNPQHPPVQTRFVLTGLQDSKSKTLTGYLDVKLSEDWKTYWRSPGEGGVAPSIDWKNSQNLNKVDWLWPYPQKFRLLGLETQGYKGDTLFPMTLHIEDMSNPVTIDAVLTLSSCTTICVLTDYPIKLTFLPSDLRVNEEVMFRYAQALSNVPQPSPFITVTQTSWDTSQSKLQVKLANSQGWHNPQVLVDGVEEAIRDYSFKLEGMYQEGNILTASYKVNSWLGEVDLNGQNLFVSIKDDNILAEEVTLAKAETIVGSVPDLSLASVFLFALLGGLILNIMPCVLPVLGMKLSHIVAVRGFERHQVRAQFIASSLGILTSFWILAGFIVVLKITGNAIGWGIQFQSPWFLGLMALVTGLFGTNMLGLFEVRLSSGANTWLASKGSNSLAGHYVQGMFATLLATPCSAPFLGTAVAFALGADVLTLFAIFTALALGMALPWILVAIFPIVALKLPKPGKWMSVVKVAFGVMMLATSIWLLSLLANHLPLFWVISVGLFAFIFIMARVKRVYGEKVLAVTGSASIVLIAGGLLLGSVTASQWATPLQEDLAWQRLSNAAIESHISNGRVVFVDVTADWCVTCKANKIGVFLQDPVYSLLQSPTIATIKGDWTHPESTVTDFLRQYGRYGVPFNIVYGPGAPNGIPLPVILTEDEVVNAIKHASGGSI